MSNRAIRRAAERKAANLAAQARTASVGGETSDFIAAALDFIPPTATEPRALSDARLAANRANAQHSTGPRTQTGQAKSSMNALKTGLTGQTVLLPTEDAIVYQAFVESIFDHWAPATDQENRLVQLIADTEWRIHRIAPLEAGIFAVARLEQPDLFCAETDTRKRDALVNAKIQLLYEKQLKNLALQERRLRNHHKTDTAQLEQLQQDRIEKQRSAEQAIVDEHTAAFNRAVKIANNCLKFGTAFEPAAFGFEFSFDEYSHYWDLQNAQYKLTEEFLDFHQVIASHRATQNAA
jgi:hypothetical protein